MTSMQFMSWSLNEPSNAQFQQYAVETEPGVWRVDNPNAFLNWGGDQKNFWIAFLKHHQKISSFGLHDFGVRSDGTIYSYKAGTTFTVLNDEGQVQYWIRDSLRYLLDSYPSIEWFLQAVCMGAPVESMLDNESSQTTFIHQFRLITEQYIERFPNRIKGLEIDFEKSSSRPREFREAEKYRDFLARVKNEIAIPLGLKLRVNLHAMTGDFNPYWYQWTDYRTLATGRDKNGNDICDEWQIMSYDFAHNNSAPGPSTPVWWLQQVLAHVNNVFRNENVWIGNAAYGRRWPLEAKRSGTAVRYWQLLMWQNGIFKHNIGRPADTGAFTWVDQSYIPYCGFHDDESGYQRTFLHCYDRFRVDYGKLQGAYNNQSVIFRSTYQGQRYITSFSKHQRSKFSGVEAIVHNGTARGNYTTPTRWTPDGFSQTFTAYNTHRATYRPNHDLERCELDEEAGNVTYSFHLNQPGKYRLIAVVYFPYLNGKIPLTINGHTYTIGDDVPDWYPFYVNPDRHFYDCGEWDLQISNTIQVGVTEDSAAIMGFVICDHFEHGMTGGYVEYDVNLQAPYKRGTIENGIVTKEEASFPQHVTLTGELLRRPPRPAIVWEDLFGPHARLNANGEKEVKNLVETPYYQRARMVTPSGNQYENRQCVGTAELVGYSNGNWEPFAENYCFADARGQSAQLLLHKEFQFNPHIEADATALDSGQVGIRFYAKGKGQTGNGYLFLADFQSRQYRLVYQSNGQSQTLATAPIGTLQVGSRYTYRVRVHNGRILCLIGSNTVIDYTDQSTNRMDRGAHGIYASGCRIRCHRLHVATNDRYEPMEKVQVIVDSQEQPIALEESRPYSYDELGYLVYSGFNPDQGLDISISNDYENLPIATIPSWIGEKKVKIRLADAGVWLRSFYVGDSEGYSIAWNSDLEGFMTTLKMIEDYGCKGVAMWTVGQEDPRVFTYLPGRDDR
ncbi:glycoside hydrolase family 18 protein [Halalkalibacterium halodurans]|uniref:glycoside hydrolase n=1 Tax=Halalkalibacterium halodurans TaxID=86665 RepID=UPI002AAA2DE7|nr:glycoside hydrolase [Halalkalibacterium halodurans]MDY7224598.1 glycoside hydrolase [Halalkalibacterium halodurans]MDY7239760.1 glycoside hydrolase [Halalkalibacterium halodurans]MED4123475.1 glycoside hydrolase [Halalkalibacterium halodurans]